MSEADYIFGFLYLIPYRARLVLLVVSRSDESHRGGPHEPAAHDLHIRNSHAAVLQLLDKVLLISSVTEIDSRSIESNKKHKKYTS